MTRSGTHHHAFTLIELIIVIAIIGLLMGLLLPSIAVIRSSAMRTNTENLLRKVDTALHGFKVDARAFPYAKPPTDPAGPWENDLGYRLAHTLTDNQFTAFDTDVAAARAAYLPGGSHCIVGAQAAMPRSVIRRTNDTHDEYDETKIANNEYSDGEKDRIASAANRLGGERATVAIMCGNVAIQGTEPNGALPWKDSATAILPNANSVGWASDYLKGQLQKGELRLDAQGLAQSIIDRYGRQLVYVNPTANGVMGFDSQCVDSIVDPVWFGFHRRNRTVTLSMNSDIRSTAAQPHVADYELWSAGRDGRFHAQRNHQDNRDNISIVRYTKGLQ